MYSAYEYYVLLSFTVQPGIASCGVQDSAAWDPPAQGGVDGGEQSVPACSRGHEGVTGPRK